MTVHGLVLAGGSGERLGGVRKADLRLGNRTLVDHVVTRLGPLQAPLLLSVGPRPARPSQYGLEISDSRLPIGGPMAGLIAAALHLRGRAAADDLLISVAVDTPYLPADYVPRLVAAMRDGAQAACASWRGNVYPTNAAWRLSALVARLGSPESIPHSPKRLLAELDAIPVDWSAQEATDPFANLNTIADLVSLGRRAQSAGS